MQFTYTWLHVSTEETGQRTKEFLSLLEALKEINNWNRLGEGKWVYWLTGIGL